MSTPELQVTDAGYYLPNREVTLPEISDTYLPDNTYLHFEFGAHTEADHFDAAEAQLKKADIYVPEAVGWDDKLVTRLQRISKSNRSNYKKIYSDRARSADNPYAAAMYDGLQGTNIYVACVDMTKEEFEEGDFRSVFDGLERDSFAEQVKTFYVAAHSFAYEGRARDKVILQNIGPAVTKLVTDVPRLRSKDKVGMLATFGASHMPLYEHLIKDGPRAHRVSAAVWSQLHDSLDISLTVEVNDCIKANKPVPLDLMKRYTVARLTEQVMASRSNQKEVEFRNKVLNVVFENFEDGSAEAVHKVTTGTASKTDSDQVKAYAVQAAEDLGLIQ